VRFLERAHTRGTDRAFRIANLFCENGLPGVKGRVICAAHHDGKTVARGIFGEVFIGDGGVLFEPVFRSEFFEGVRKLSIDLRPCLLEVGS